MQTKLCMANARSIAQGAKWIRAGEVVAFPTETVYGLGADALNPIAVHKIFDAKGRPADNPLIVHIAEEEELPALVTAVPDMAKKLMKAYWPGPMTLIFPKSDDIPDIVSAGGETVGVRMPQSAVARALITQAGCPIAAPSANRSGSPSPTTAQRVLEDMNGRIPLILDGGESLVGVESTVIDVTGTVPIILRPGGITPEMVAQVCGEVQIDAHVMRPLEEGEAARSPGMKYKHYAPRASVIVFDGEAAAVQRAICARYDAAKQHGQAPMIFAPREHDYGTRTVYAWGSASHPEEAAAALFEALRQMDDEGADIILAEGVDKTGIGLAVMNRLGRAAGFQIERV